MRIVECFGNGRPVFSFEFFPPKTDEGAKNLYHTVEELKPLGPDYVSVTYGAGGSTRELTVELVTRIKREIGIEAMAHLTCVGHTGAEIAGILDQLRDGGIENVLPLRGDPPRGETTFVKTEGGFGYASELVRFIRGGGWNFCLAGGCYPERHQEAATADADMLNLKEKVDGGVDFLITQLFFAPEIYFDFVSRARDAGIRVPIVPGIMPVTNVNQIERLTTMCGASFPPALRERLEPVRDDEESVAREGIRWATEQCQALLDGGAPGIHFYTLNRSRATREIFGQLRR